MTSTEQIDWGHWLIRLIAFIIDGIILGIVVAIISAVFAIASIFTGGFNLLGWDFLTSSFIWGVLLVLYFAILDFYWGATIGKRLLSIQVRTVTGGKVPFDKALIRNISKIFWPLLILDWIVGIVTPGDKRQKFLDRTVGVTFVRTGQSFASTTQSYPPPPPPPT
jgi:uncharacterized RDD family membrane protein YckC